MTKVMLVGNPNSGKTTLFNALTGESQRVGNWPGVTVEKKLGFFVDGPHTVEIIDLPGVYSLSVSAQAARDAQITAQAVVSEEVEVIINVIDACHLERHLYLTTQLLELGKPIVIALNMTDIAKQRGISIDIKTLSQYLQCPVVVVQANQKVGIAELQQVIGSTLSVSQFHIKFPDTIEDSLQTVENELHKNPHYPDSRLMAGNRDVSGHPDDDHNFIRYQARRLLESGFKLPNQNEVESSDILMADARYHQIHAFVQVIQSKNSDASDYLTAKIDRMVLHRVWGLPIFFTVMYLVFFLAIHVGGAFQDFFDLTTDALFVQGTSVVLGMVHAPHWVISLCANGVGQGIHTTITFAPVIAAMFFLLSLLETSGYMARAAFVIDKMMRVLGLPGKSFVPMIVGFGCNVPGILAARTLESERDRMLTVLMSPYMSCSARLTIYAVFATAFFPVNGQNMVFLLYLIGMVMAVLTGLLLRKTSLSRQASPLILELPAYHRPSWDRLWKETTMRLRHFLIRAGKLIIPICMLLGVLNSVTVHGGELSILAYIGQWLTPIFLPMGIHADNWPAVVGLLTGTLAKEVVIGTLNNLYGQLPDQGIIQSMDLVHSLQTALWTIPHHFAQWGQTLSHPLLTHVAAPQSSQPIYGMLYQHFGSKAAAFSYLLFILLYIPCVSTMAAIRQETNKRYMWFSILWSLLIAYAAAVMFYQTATCMVHIKQTMMWAIILTAVIFSVVVIIMRGGRHAVATA